MDRSVEIGGLVLCGGQSRRMGQPKAWLPFGPHEVLLQRITRLLAEEVEAVVVVAANGQALPSLDSEVQIVRDEAPEQGPLGGLAVGFAAFPASVRYVFVKGTDSPFLAPGWLTVLRQSIGDYDVALPYLQGRHHPLAALYDRAEVLPVITRNLSEGRLRLMGIFDEIRYLLIKERPFREVDPTYSTILNLNTWDEYQRALADHGFPPSNPS